MKSLGTFQVQNKMFNLHIIQVMYKIRGLWRWGEGKGPEQILEHGDTFTHGRRGENTSNTIMFCAINSLRTKWPHLIPHKC